MFPLPLLFMPAALFFVGKWHTSRFRNFGKSANLVP
jgi:hypothetical protein